MLALSTRGMLKTLGLSLSVLGCFMVANIASLAYIYIRYYELFSHHMQGKELFLWLTFAIEPLSGAMIGISVTLIGIVMLRPVKWKRTFVFCLLLANVLIIGAWTFLHRFHYAGIERVVKALVMYLLIVIFFNLKSVRLAYS